MRFFIPLTAICWALLCFKALAATRYVDLNCTNSVVPYTSWATAATNIQDAINAAGFGDAVLVTNGIYQCGGAVHPGQIQTNRVFVPFGLGLAIQSVNGPAVTVIKGYQVPGTTNGTSAVRCVYLTESSTLSGFTLTNGATVSSQGGGGATMESSCVVSNCVITGNASDVNGAGISSVNNGLVANCTVAGNTALYGGGEGGGVYGCTLNNCLISSNNATHGGGIYICTANNCLFTGNGNTNITDGGAADGSTLNNCTLAGNFSHGLGAAEACTLDNSIIYYNTNNNGYADCYQCKLTDCCTTIGNGNSTLPNNSISNAPAFVDMVHSNYHLQIGSPGMDAGTNIYAPAGTDLDGNARIVNGTVDMGAYENQNTNQVHYVSLTSTNPVTPYTNWLTAATNIQDAVSVAQNGEIVLAASGIYKFGGAVVYGSETNRVALTNAITLLGLYGSQSTAIVGGTQMRCAYVGSNSLLMGFTFTNGHARSTGGDITNEQSGGGVWCETGGSVSNCILSGNFAITGHGGGIYGGMVFNSTLTNNTAGYGGGAASASLFNCLLVTNTAQISAYGGGVYQGTLSNCTLTANWAYTAGGGAYQSTLYNCVLNSNSVSMVGGGAQASVLLNCTLKGNIGTAVSQCTNYSCVLTGNSGSQGAGMNGGIAYNCILSNNTASVFGGGAYQGTLYNCTVIGNSAGSGGGAYGSTLYNSILYYNSAPSGSNYSSGVGGGFNYCCTMPLPAGPYPGCFTNAPVFVNLAGGDLHQQTNSPCINGGLNYNVTNLAKITTDFDGNPRIVGGTVDVGAYEYQGSNLGLPIPIPWLRQYGLPTDGSADSLDSDGDGMNNWQEWKAGTNPTNAASVLQLASPSNSVSGVTVTWQSVTNVIYYLLCSTNLPAFTSIQSNIVGQAGATSYTDTTATNAGPYFYRVGVQ